MFIKNIFINNFRNYKSLSLNFNKGINIIIGNNAQGKTNLLESIYVLGLTKSHRSFIDNNLINSIEKKARIKGNIIIENFSKELEITIQKNSKILKIDKNTIKKTSDYISNMNIIIFYPEDLDLVKGSPNIRRRYLNLELSQLYSNYINIINDYNKLLKMRNDYLKQKNVDNNYLDIITNYLIDKSILIYKMRNKFVIKLNEKIEKIFFDISNFHNFNIKYINSIKFLNYEEEYLKMKLNEEFENIRVKELKYKSTLIGPHKDDIEFYLEDMNLKNLGSQGQQRIAILSLKLAEIDIFKKYKGETPILLLDDVFSELDENKKNNLLKYINEEIQTIITTTDINNIDKSIINKSKIIEIEEGNIKNIEEVEEDGTK